MATGDISRSAFYRSKNYAGVRMQQGRVLTDDDYNEGERIHHEDRRQTRLDVIGPYGSPDEGFSIDPDECEVKEGRIDFWIRAGTFYLGGMLLELEGEVKEGNPPKRGEYFLSQRDWLRNPGEPAPGAPTDAGPEDFTREPVPRTDLVYLEAWQQPVSTVEDEELREEALGGPDTTTRMRNIRRVRVHKDVGTDSCVEAWQMLLDHWKEATGELRDDHELIPDTQLEVGFVKGGNKEDLCTPFAPGGYLGAENQTIRVKLLKDKKFTWGFDNGAPLHRIKIVKVDEVEGLTTVEMLTAPKDEAHWPLAGQAVEILPWSAVIANGEKLAEELEPGQFAKIQGSYDPESRLLTLSSKLDLKKLQPRFRWKRGQPGQPELDPLTHTRFGLEEHEEYLFMRVWDRGDGGASEATLPLQPGANADTQTAKLGSTGLKVTIAGKHRRPGDFWIIAARPETPGRVVPWELEVKRPPHGPKRYYAPLALIHWTRDGGSIKGTAHDCRKTFRPLTEIATCCSVTVGDGVHSHGVFDRLQKAVDSLPSSEGGEICVLPGEHEGNVILKDRKHITIRGCGQRSKLLPGEKGPGSPAPVIRIENGEDITIRSLAIDSSEGEDAAIELVTVVPSEGTWTPGGKPERITLMDLDLTVRDYSAIVGRGGSWISVRDCRVAINSLLVQAPIDKESGRGLAPAVFLAGHDIRVDENSISGPIINAEARVDAKHTPVGGLVIGGDSKRIEIRRNRISGGNGNGVTLGSYRSTPSEESDIDVPSYRTGGRVLSGPLFIEGDCCPELDVLVTAPEGAEEEKPDPDGPLTDVQIIDNRIFGMGSSGIAVAGFFQPGTEQIAVRRLLVEGNHIHDCVRLDVKGREFSERPMLEHLAYGGLVLSEGEAIVVRSNLIEYNGADRIREADGSFSADPASTRHDPICGCFVLLGEAIVIEGNRVLHNGRLADPETSPPGHRGGIVIALALPGHEEFFLKRLTLTDRDGTSAARIHHNVVVSPEGRALYLGAIGPVSVHANQLSAMGSPRSIGTPEDGLGGASVMIFNLGRFRDFLTGNQPAFTTRLVAEIPESIFFNWPSGNVLFNDNQVLLDTLGPAATRTFSSVLLTSLDDVGMVGNQCDCDLAFGASDFAITNTLVYGATVRVADNRFREGAFSAFLSALTWGFMNSTVNNHGTRCFLVVGHKDATTYSPNHSVAGLFKLCAELGELELPQKDLQAKFT